MPSGYSLFTNCSFDSTKTNLFVTGVQAVWKGFIKDLKEHTTKIINYEKKK